MNKQVRKAVVPAAGLGTRFFPTTLAVPKELLPLDRRPAIHHIVREAADCGIETMVFVLSRGKESLLHYFLRNPAIGGEDRPPEQQRLLEEVQVLREQMEFVAVYQEEALGLGHAVLCARSAVGDEPFAVMLPDDNFIPSPLPALVQSYEERGIGGIAVKRVNDDEVSRFGIVDVESEEEGLFILKGAVEKPLLEDAPSRLAIMGRYVLPPEVFERLLHTRPGAKGEIQITDALHKVAAAQGLTGVLFEGTYLDLGTWEGFVLANLRMSMKDPALAPRIYEMTNQE
jgi:UTP--glucose-1-phosphate uridylyltransferase